MSVLDGCRGFFGEPLKPDLKRRIRRFLCEPTVDNWDDIHGIVINPDGLGTTVWQAVLAVDPSFPRRGRMTDVKGNVLKEWERVPSPLLVLRAIKQATR